MLKSKINILCQNFSHIYEQYTVKLPLEYMYHLKSLLR